ncbi:hypothetical protein [Phocaeicola coprophilus]|uniref:hypothetical protein n=1 Tax=Phocaeicola coprophilus TaxID=387090 RepID=UPI00266FC825|nr:hypothetical protein [Phocaeicola coprophilus]
MKKNKEKEKYESPLTKKTTVSLENGICAASADVQNPNEENGRIQEHEVNPNFDFDFKDNQNWDEIK